MRWVLTKFDVKLLQGIEITFILITLDNKSNSLLVFLNLITNLLRLIEILIKITIIINSNV